MSVFHTLAYSNFLWIQVSFAPFAPHAAGEESIFLTSQHVCREDPRSSENHDPFMTQPSDVYVEGPRVSSDTISNIWNGKDCVGDPDLLVQTSTVGQELSELYTTKLFCKLNLFVCLLPVVYSCMLAPGYIFLHTGRGI